MFKSLDRIRQSVWLVTLPCSSVIIHDDTRAVRKIIAYPVPITMITAITADEQKRIACPNLFIREMCPIREGDKWHEDLLTYLLIERAILAYVCLIPRMATP